MSLQNNSVHVDSATTSMSVGMVADIKEKAMREVTVAEQTQREAQTSLKSSGAEGNVYGAVATEALMPGAKVISTVMEFIDARTSDKNGQVENNNPARTVDKDIEMAARPPGLYKAEPVGSVVYDGMAANTPHVPLRVVDGGKSTTKDVFEKASLASSSLKDQEPQAIGSWGIPPKQQAAVAEAKQALANTYDVKMANETAFNSALVVERQHAAMMYKASQAPGMNLGSAMAAGPQICPEKLLNQIETTTAA